MQASEATKNRRLNLIPNSSPEPNNGRVMPHSIEAEKSLLGAIMLHQNAINKAAEIIGEKTFYSPRHREIWNVMRQMSDERIPIDLLTLREELKKKGKLADVGGESYIIEISRSVPSAANIERYALIMQEKYLKREIIEVSSGLWESAYSDTSDAIELLDKAEYEIFKISEKKQSRKFQDMASLAHKTYSLIEQMTLNKNKGITGVKSGIFHLDKLLGGFQNSDLIIIAARPSMGKTALALSIARNVAVAYKNSVAFFSLEMASTQILMRLLSAEAPINQQSLRTGSFQSDDMTKVVQGMGRLSNCQMYIDDSSAMDIFEFRSKCRRLRAEKKVKLIVVDYLQLLKAPKSESREREISIISQTLKQIAKELEIPVVALAQLSRAVENRADKRPLLSDLRESGSIEQDADVVMFVHRPEYFKIMEYPDGQSTEGTAELIVAKHRNGPTDTIRVAFHKDYARFDNLDIDLHEFDKLD